jgi:hypothetical protein
MPGGLRFQISELRDYGRLSLIIDRRVHSHFKPRNGRLDQLDTSAGIGLPVRRQKAASRF